MATMGHTSGCISCREQKHYVMSAKHYFLLGGAIGLVCGLLALLVRPARLRTARVTAVAGQRAPVAGVTLAYGQGVAPLSVIVDGRSRAGAAGSATIDGRQQFVEVPIAGRTDGGYVVTATVSYRVLGALRTKVYEFAES